MSTVRELSEAQKNFLSTRKILNVCSSTESNLAAPTNELDLVMTAQMGSGVVVLLGESHRNRARRIFLSSVLHTKEIEIDHLRDSCLVLKSAEGDFESYQDLKEVIFNGIIFPQSTRCQVFSLDIVSHFIPHKFLLSSSINLFSHAQKYNFQIKNAFFLKDWSSGEKKLTDASFKELINFISINTSQNPQTCCQDLFRVCRDLESFCTEDVLKLMTNVGEVSTNSSPKKVFTPLDVLVITPEYRGFSIAGGVATMLSDLVKNFRLRGQRVTVLTPLYQIDQ